MPHSNPRSVVAHLAVASAVALAACGEHAADRGAAEDSSLTSSCGNAAAWAPGVSYAVGDLASYAGDVYRCVQAHTSLASWRNSCVWDPLAP